MNKAELKQELKTWLPETRLLEKSNREQAIREYKRMAKAYPLSETVYNRIMILYHQLKEPDQELRWIDKAIKTFEKHFAKPRFKARANAKINILSKSILRSTGLIDKNGKALHQPQPIARWQKRKELLEARIAR